MIVQDWYVTDQAASLLEVGAIEHIVEGMADLQKLHSPATYAWVWFYGNKLIAVNTKDDEPVMAVMTEGEFASSWQRLFRLNPDVYHVQTINRAAMPGVNEIVGLVVDVTVAEVMQ